MKTKRVFNSLTFLFISYLIGFLNQNAYSSILIAEWGSSYIESNPPADGRFTATGGVGSNLNRSVLMRDSTATVFNVFADQNPASSGWQNADLNERYWIISFSTEGYENLTLNSWQRGSNAGPKEFKIQYKTADDSWADLSGGMIPNVGNNNYTTGKVTNLPLPPELENKSSVSIRWICSSTARIQGAGTVASNGINRIKVTINGEKIIPPQPVISVNNDTSLLFTFSQRNKKINVSGFNLLDTIRIYSENSEFSFFPAFMDANAHNEELNVTFNGNASTTGRIILSSKNSEPLVINLRACLGPDCSLNDGSKTFPYTVEEALQLQDNSSCWIKGYIIGCVNSGNGKLISDSSDFVKTNLALGSDPEGTAYLSVQLPDNIIRASLNVIDNPLEKAKAVLIYGNLAEYCRIPGIRATSDYDIISGPLISACPSPVKDMSVGTVRMLNVYTKGITGNISIIVEDSTIITTSVKSFFADSIKKELVLKAHNAGNTVIAFKNEELDIEERVNISVIPLNSDASLKYLKVGKQFIKLIPGIYTYRADPVAYNTDFLKVIAKTERAEAIVTKGDGDHKLIIGNNILEIRTKAEDKSEKIYRVYITRECMEPYIQEQMPADISVCEGKAMKLEVKAKGDGLKYQWFFEQRPIEGAISGIYSKNNTELSDYGKYHVEVTGACGSAVIGNEIRLWVAEPLPEALFLSVPDTVFLGQRYKVSVGYDYGYKDVTEYLWSYSNENAFFYSGVGNNTPVTFVTFGPLAVNGTIKVSMRHVCGKREISRRIKVFDQNTQLEKLTENPTDIFPNPVTDLLNIQNMNGKVIYKILVIDFSGKVIIDQSVNSQFYQLSMKNREKGYYFVVLFYSEYVYEVYKIIKK